MGESQLTAGDETGARAEMLKTIRTVVKNSRHERDGRRGPRMLGAVEFLLAELDRVTAARESEMGAREQMLIDHAMGRKRELDAAIASRNAWAQKAVERSHDAVDAFRKQGEEIEKLRHDVKRLREGLERARVALTSERPGWFDDATAETRHLYEVTHKDAVFIASEALRATEPKDGGA